MLPLVTYLLLIAAALGLAALAAERFLVEIGLVRRAVWTAALAASIALPASVMLAGQNGPALAIAPLEPEATPAPLRAEGILTVGNSEGPPETRLADSRDEAPAGSTHGLWSLIQDWYTAGRSSSSRLDRWLATLWIASSAAILLIYGVARLGLRRAARRWRPVRLEGRDVLISDRVGPAMFGLITPRIVVPSWLLESPPQMRNLALQHEREHARARDQLLLAAALVLVALAPWNPALWWQLRRLRLAIEIDCDARVVRGGADAVTYSKMLLAIRQRSTAAPLAAVALSPVSLLERRIRALLPTRTPMRRALGIGGITLAAALVIAACDVNPPPIGIGADDASPVLPAGRQPVTGMRLGDDRAVILVDVSASMLDRTEAGIARRQSLSDAQRRRAPKWRQLIESVDGLTARIQPGAQFQIIAFNDEAGSLVAGTDGEWLTATDRKQIGQALRTLREDTTPEGGSNLTAAFTAAGTLQPPPETIYLVTDGAGPPGPATTRPVAEDAQGALGGTAINVILLPMEGASDAASVYWELAFQTGGSLLAPSENAAADAVFSVPLDSEYIIFIIDTSGSMQRYAWDRVQQQIQETLTVYPEVKGIQVMDDMGREMFLTDRGEWMEDSAQLRRDIIEELEDWKPFSNSSPREGIIDAVRNYYDPNKKISLYIYGDDFSPGATIDSVVREVDYINRYDDEGNLVPADERRVRIHAVAFPVYLEYNNGRLATAARFAALMRVLCQRNGGTFIALPSTRE